jgi:hypothetical protein
MIAVVEERDVPGLAGPGVLEIVEELEEGVRPLRKLCSAGRGANGEYGLGNGRSDQLDAPNMKTRSPSTWTLPPIIYRAWSLLISSLLRSQASMSFSLSCWSRSSTAVCRSSGVGPDVDLDDNRNETKIGALRFDVWSAPTRYANSVMARGWMQEWNRRKLRRAGLSSRVG